MEGEHMKHKLKGLMVLILCLFISGCTMEKEVKDETITITDQAGRVVTLDQPVEKIVSGYYIATTTLIGLGQTDKIVGVEMKADTRAIYQKAAPELLELPAMGNKKSFNVEECAKAHPDVVFLPVSLKSYVDKLEDLDMKVILLDPETMQDFNEAVDIIANVCGAQERAQTYKDFQQRLQTTYVRSQKDEKETIYFAGSDILQASGEHMFQGELIKNAGANNAITDTTSTSWFNINKEELLKADPSYILIEQAGADIEAVKKDASLQALQAINRNHIYEFPSALETWDTPNLSYCLGELWLKSILEPESISMDQVLKEAQQFYQEFYGIEVTAEDLGI